MRLVSRPFILLVAMIAGCIASGPDRIAVEQFDAPSLQGSLLPNEPTQPVVVYLPPAYDDSTSRYPVVYYLPGFTTDVTEYIDGTFDGLHAGELLDRAIAEGRVGDFLLVVVQGRNALGGSFYVDSPVTGDWEHWVVDDVVEQVDARYRTLATRASRVIAGDSMGGFGAIHIAMRHADTFGSLYAISPGLFDEDGLDDQGMFSRPGYVTAHLLQEERIDAWPAVERIDRFVEFVGELYRGNGFAYRRGFVYAYGAAFAPDPRAEGPPWIDYPFSRDCLHGGSCIPDPGKLALFEQGFGNLAQEVSTYQAQLRSLRAITIHAGANDPVVYIPKGSQRLSELLDAAGIANELRWDERGHVGDMAGRWREGLIPFLARYLEGAQPEVER